MQTINRINAILATLTGDYTAIIRDNPRCVAVECATQEECEALDALEAAGFEMFESGAADPGFWSYWRLAVTTGVHRSEMGDRATREDEESYCALLEAVAEELGWSLTIRREPGVHDAPDAARRALSACWEAWCGESGDLEGSLAALRRQGVLPSE